MELTGSTFDPGSVFVSAVQQQAQMESLANAALSTGIDHFQNQRYQEAADAFARSVALSPASPYAATAAEYQANAFLKLGRPDKAADAYETMIRLDPQSDAGHAKLGNLHFSQQRYKDAEAAYRKAVAVNPNATNRYSLGQALLQTGDLPGAEREFGEVARLIPDQPNGFYGLALTYSRQGRVDKAVEHFETAIEKDSSFHTSHLDLGIALADNGRMEEAMAQYEVLRAKDEALADQLNRYLYKVDPPKIEFAGALSTFRYTMPMRTPLSALDGYLAEAGAEKTFTMIFQFDKEMDRSSVEDVYNWSIGKADGPGPANHYNFGLGVDETDARLPPYPEHVYYDAKALTATVRFTLKQNASADATIDPSHVVFQFRGEDEFGNRMDPAHDEFSGFSRIA
jgi:tetratricopeptide (TPR) repeat protein